MVGGDTAAHSTFQWAFKVFKIASDPRMKLCPLSLFSSFPSVTDQLNRGQRQTSGKVVDSFAPHLFVFLCQTARKAIRRGSMSLLTALGRLREMWAPNLRGQLIWESACRYCSLLLTDDLLPLLLLQHHQRSRLRGKLCMRIRAEYTRQSSIRASMCCRKSLFISLTVDLLQAPVDISCGGSL